LTTNDTPSNKSTFSSSYKILKKEDCEKNKKGYQRCPVQSIKE